MKFLFTTIIYVLAYTNVVSAETPIKLIVDKEVIVSSVDSNVSPLDIFESVKYNREDAALEFTSCEKITKIRIYNEIGLLEFELPVNSYRVILNKSIFGQGKYMLGFIIKDIEDVHLTHVNFL